MVEKVAHGFGAGCYVWCNAFGEASKFVCCAVYSLASFGSPDQLGMSICFSRDSIDDTVGGLKSNGCRCNVGGKAGYL
jgi:hypothetical protein